MNEEVIKIETKVINQVLDYLSNQPFKEVYQLIGEIQHSAQQCNKEEEKESKEQMKVVKNNKQPNQ